MVSPWTTTKLHTASRPAKFTKPKVTLISLTCGNVGQLLYTLSPSLTSASLRMSKEANVALDLETSRPHSFSVSMARAEKPHLQSNKGAIRRCGKETRAV